MSVIKTSGQAIIEGALGGSYTISSSSNKLKLTVNGVGPLELSISGGEYTTVEMVAEINAKLKESFSYTVVAIVWDNKVVLATADAGAAQSLILHTTTNSIHATLGMTPATSTGSSNALGEDVYDAMGVKNSIDYSEDANDDQKKEFKASSLFHWGKLSTAILDHLLARMEVNGVATDVTGVSTKVTGGKILNIEVDPVLHKQKSSKTAYIGTGSDRADGSQDNTAAGAQNNDGIGHLA